MYFFWALTTIGFAVANRLRGTKNYLVAVPCLFLAALVLLASSGNWIAAGVTGLAYLLGENWGWTKWLHGLKFDMTQKQYNAKWLLDDTGKTNGTFWLAEMVADERKDYKTHVVAGAFFRGLYWWVPVMVSLAWFGLVSWWLGAMLSLLLALAFPVAYYIGFRVKVGDYGYLQKSEVIYGAFYGLVLGWALF